MHFEMAVHQESRVQYVNLAKSVTLSGVEDMQCILLQVMSPRLNTCTQADREGESNTTPIQAFSMVRCLVHVCVHAVQGQICMQGRLGDLAAIPG